MLIGLFGTGRNGSSLIGRLLDGLEDTYVHPVEEIFISKFDDLNRVGRLTRLTAQNCTNRELTHVDGELSIDVLANAYAESLSTLYQTYIISCEATRHLAKPSLPAFLKSPKYSLEKFIREYLEGLGKYVLPDLDIRHYLFKSIETPYIREYAERFPEMKFVHIIRHPVPLCSSQKRSLLENKKLPACYLGYDWLVSMIDRRWLPHARFITEMLHDPRHTVVRYESLVKNPQDEIARIARNLDLRPPPRPDLQTVFFDQDKKDWGFNPSKAGAKTPEKVVADLQAKLGYEEILTDREIDYINYKTAALQECLGYTPSSRPSRRSVLAKYAMIDRWEWANVRGARSIARALYGAIYRRFSLL